MENWIDIFMLLIAAITMLLAAVQLVINLAMLRPKKITENTTVTADRLSKSRFPRRGVPGWAVRAFMLFLYTWAFVGILLFGLTKHPEKWDYYRLVQAVSFGGLAYAWSVLLEAKQAVSNLHARHDARIDQITEKMSRLEDELRSIKPGQVTAANGFDSSTSTPR